MCGLIAAVPLVSGMRDPTVHECPECGSSVSRFAAACPHCDAPNPGRKSAFTVAIAALVLTVAAAVGIGALAWLWWSGDDLQQQAGDDLAWLTAAMAACDEDATRTPGTLFFIVIPLQAEPSDIPEWRKKSLNDIGNGVLLDSATALDGLREKTLKLSTEQYVFGIRDQSEVVYKWKSGMGVARFSTPEADAITSFNIQFLAGAGAREGEWGAGFSRQAGSCYWVNAIIGI